MALMENGEIQKRESLISDRPLRKKPQNRRAYLNSLVAGGSFGRAARPAKEVVPYEVAVRNMRSLNSLTAGGAFGKRSRLDPTTTKADGATVEYVLKKYLNALQMKNLFDSNSGYNTFIVRMGHDYVPHVNIQKNDSLWAFMKLGNIPSSRALNGDVETYRANEDMRNDLHQKAFNKNEPLPPSAAFQDVDAYHLSDYLQRPFPTP